MDLPDTVVSHVPDGIRQRDIEGMDSPEPPDVDSPPESLLISASAIGVGVLTRKALTKVWPRVRGSQPPQNPAAPGVSWSDALIWAVAVGATIGVARVISRRTATKAARHWS